MDIWLFAACVFILYLTCGQALNSDCRCWENPIFRVSCPSGDSLDETSCRQAGCCYDDQTLTYHWPRPKCYMKKGTCPKDEKCIVYSGREVCGHRAMGRTLCEMKRCCFDNSQYPFCYKPKAVPTTSFTTRTSTFTIPTTAATTTSILTSPTTVFSTSYRPAPSTTRPTASTITATLTSRFSTMTSQFSTLTSSPTTMTSSSALPTSRPPFTYLGGPFGFYQIGNMLMYSECPRAGNESCLDGSVTDESNCTRNYCCWNKELVGSTYDPCYRPSIRVINWPDPGKNQTELPKWTPWTLWSSCMGQPCRVGIRTRERTCENKTPALACTGVGADVEQCESPCPKTWGPWTAWSGCDVKCGPGITTRRRSCVDDGGSIVSNTGCPQGSFAARESLPCQTDFCTTWSPWITGPCSSSCGRGIRNNTRICFGESSRKSPTSCYYVTALCDDVPCPLPTPSNPEWGPWTPWSRCSEPCGTGTRSRIRMCYDSVNGEPVSTGSRPYCDNGPGFQVDGCNTGFCSAWSSWSSGSSLCSASCGITESRSCVGSEAVMSPFVCFKRTVRCATEACA